jgi:hypothetical protein
VAKGNNKQKMADFVARLNKAIEATTGPEEIKKIGGFLIQKIAVRTRLGYGVTNHLDEKSSLKPLSPKYKQFRKDYPYLYGMTTPNKSNLTLTGSMIDSLRIKNIGKNSIRIGPTGTDRNGVSNSSKAYWQEKMGRVFLRLSFQEVKQARIFWKRQFSDLLK